MQKFWIVLAAFLCLPACLSAQYRASQGDVSVEVQFDPFGFRDVDEGFGGAKFRVFLTDRDALRLNVDFGLESVEYKEDEDVDDVFSRGRVADLSIDLGYERHFKVAKRASVYAGVQVGFFRHFASGKAGYTEDYTNGSFSSHREYEIIYENCILDANGDVSDRAYRGVGGQLFTGVDFYLYKGLYIGSEIGLSVDAFKSCQTKMDIGGEGTVKSKDVETSVVAGFVRPMLRLGWTF